MPQNLPTSDLCRACGQSKSVPVQRRRGMRPELGCAPSERVKRAICSELCAWCIHRICTVKARQWMEIRRQKHMAAYSRKEMKFHEFDALVRAPVPMINAHDVNEWLASYLGKLAVTSCRSKSIQRKANACPNCEARITVIIRAHNTDAGYRRYRLCRACMTHFTTIEKVEP